MYPLNVTLGNGEGFAVANDKVEHKSLSDAGYLPAFTDTNVSESNPLKAEAEALGITVDARWGDKRIAAEIAKVKV